MVKRRQVIEIFAPTAGRKHDAPPDFIDRRAMPNNRDAKMFYGVNQKEYGTSIFATGSNVALGATVNMIFNARFTDGNSMQVLTATSVFKYSEAADSFVTDGQSFSSTYTDFWHGVVYNEQFFYTNGKELIQVKQSLSSTGNVMASSTDANLATYKAYALSGFRDHLNLYHVFEDDTEYAKRVRWTKKGALTLSAATTDFGSGTAGAVDIPDCEGEIKTSAPVGLLQAVYAERSIHLQSWVGGDTVYRFQKAVSGKGTPSRRGVVSFEGINWVIGQDNFYEYRGGSATIDIGDPIKQKAFTEINNSNIATAYVEYDPRDDEVWFHIPVGTDTSPSVIWVYRRENKSWSRLERAHPAAGSFTRQKDLGIGDLQGTIGEQTFNFQDYSLRSQAEVRVYADETGRIVKKDPSTFSLSIGGTKTAQSFLYETPDLVGLAKGGTSVRDPYDRDNVEFTSVTKRWQQANIAMSGTGSAYIAYSVDRGQTFTQLPESPVVLVSTGTTHTLDLDVSSPTLRLQVTNTGANDNIGIEYVKVEFIPGSEH